MFDSRWLDSNDHEAMKPFWILRHHGSSSVRSLDYGHDWLAVGDDKGAVSLVDLATLRAAWHWTAHTDALLTVIVLGPHTVLTHARDNSLKVWDLTPPADTSATSSPKLVREIGVNALNFAACSVCPALSTVAVPNALDPAYIDVLHLESGKRVHEAVSRPDIASHKSRAGARQPIIMSLHLLGTDSVIAGYEDGVVVRWSLSDGAQEWRTKCHSESVMATALSHNSVTRFGISVGADDRIAKFDVGTGKLGHLVTSATPGNASVAIAPNDATFVVGGWDGLIRVYSAESLDLLGTLRYHRDTVDTLAFCPSREAFAQTDSDDSSSDTSPSGSYTLAAGGRDGKVSLWEYH